VLDGAISFLRRHFHFFGAVRVIIDAALLERILDKDELLPCFQPLVELRTGCLKGFELLARWRHPELGLILPGSFIEVAEKSGLLPRLTQHLLRNALLSVPALPIPFRLSLNVSPLQMGDLRLPQQILDASEGCKFPLNRLTIEVTETALMHNHKTAQTIIGELKEMGCELLLDDFGTGYSSLRHLQMLKFDGMKIDRSFVAGIAKNRESRKIVAALIGLGQSLSMTTVAEGIESEEQAGILLCLGCDLGQGWLYGHPKPVESIPEVLRKVPLRQAVNWSAREGNLALSSLEALPAQRMAQLQAIYDGAPVGLCFLNCSLRYVSVNHRFADLFETTVLALIGQSIEAAFPVFFSNSESYLYQALNGEPRTGIEIKLPAKIVGKQEKTLLISYEPARDDADEVVGISLAVIDITTRKLEEEALRRSEERYRTIIDLNPQVPWILDVEGNIIDFGSRWESMTGLTREQTLNHGFLKAVHPDDRERVSRSLDEAASKGLPLDFQWRALMVDGSYLWMRSRGTAVLGENGEVLRYYGTSEDIDEFKQMEAALQRCQESQGAMGGREPDSSAWQDSR